MTEPSQSIADFPAWALLNGIDINDLSLHDIPGKGFGFVVTKQLEALKGAANESRPGRNLIRIPRDLILSAEAVGDYAKVDQNFNLLLQSTSFQSTRKNIVLYLFSHLVSSRKVSASHRTGIAPTAWTEYIKLLPRDIPVPTLWPEHDRRLLQGTSLEVALNAKIVALEAEFEQLREDTTALPYWQTLWWEHETATLEDWFLADAWYRSRCLELPLTGEAMVPGLDMVNHSYEPTALYEELNDGDVALQQSLVSSLDPGEEVTISYGQTKSAAEMLFSYGFIDGSSAARELTVPLDTMSDDPLGQAKLHAYGKPPTAKLSLKDGKALYECPFMDLMCLNEEDGLDFRVLQDQDGNRHLRVFWQDQDVTERTDNFSELMGGHPLEQVFRLRTVALLGEVIESQLEGIRSPSPRDDYKTDDPARPGSALGRVDTANVLRTIETEVLEAVAVALEEEKATLLQDDTVLEYLGRMEHGQNEQGDSGSANGEPNFS